MRKKEVVDIIEFYPKISDEIEMYRMEIKKIEKSYSSCGTSIAVVSESNAITDRTLRQAEKMAMRGDGDKIRMYESEIEQLNDLQTSIFNAVKALPFAQKQVIRFKYFDGLTWDRVAKKVNYSRRQCINIGNEAVLSLAESFDKNMDMCNLFKNKL